MRVVDLTREGPSAVALVLTGALTVLVMVLASEAARSGSPGGAALVPVGLLLFFWLFMIVGTARMIAELRGARRAWRYVSRVLVGLEGDTLVFSEPVLAAPALLEAEMWAARPGEYRRVLHRGGLRVLGPLAPASRARLPARAATVAVSPSGGYLRVPGLLVEAGGGRLLLLAAPEYTPRSRGARVEARTALGGGARLEALPGPGLRVSLEAWGRVRALARLVWRGEHARVSLGLAEARGGERREAFHPLTLEAPFLVAAPPGVDPWRVAKTLGPVPLVAGPGEYKLVLSLRGPGGSGDWETRLVVD